MASDNSHLLFRMKPIGVIRTPYIHDAPYQPLAAEEGDFRLVVDPEYAAGLDQLAKFRYVYVLSYLDRHGSACPMEVSPPWAGGRQVGLFASRSPSRPNPIGLSVVRVVGIDGREVRTSSLDVFDGTPLLDIKPYVLDLDAKTDANDGWLDELDYRDHLLLHIKGIPHDE